MGHGQNVPICFRVEMICVHNEDGETSKCKL